ncbi:MAG: tRNA (N6-threonylcarbamoyladenosine(37)-N6)-methyltransferase TrmO [Candidatus Bathyarchaeota archaeon]
MKMTFRLVKLTIMWNGCEKLVSSFCTICLDPIGFVKTKAVGNEVRNKEVISQLILKENLIEALEGLEHFSHLFVIFWLNEISNEDRKTLKVHPRARADMPLLGVFATRSPHRFNPIGLTRVKLLKIKDNILTVQGLDAFNGTPVLDIKPFDSWDTTEDFKVPDWWIKLEKENKKE